MTPITFDDVRDKMGFPSKAEMVDSTRREMYRWMVEILIVDLGYSAEGIPTRPLPEYSFPFVHSMLWNELAEALGEEAFKTAVNDAVATLEYRKANK